MLRREQRYQTCLPPVYTLVYTFVPFIFQRFNIIHFFFFHIENGSYQLSFWKTLISYYWKILLRKRDDQFISLMSLLGITYQNRNVYTQPNTMEAKKLMKPSIRSCTTKLFSCWHMNTRENIREACKYVIDLKG